MAVTVRGAGAADVPLLAKLADEIWRQHFIPIIGEKQVDYMLDWFQDTEAIAAQMTEGMAYFLAYADGEAVGYCACKQEPEKLFLSKLYVRAAFRGQGVGRALFDAACGCLEGRKAVYLTVNKHNSRTIAIYKRMGFAVTDSVVAEIGGGFVMDDYIMTMQMEE